MTFIPETVSSSGLFHTVKKAKRIGFSLRTRLANPVSKQRKRPNQQVFAINDLTEAERNEFADLLEAEIARL